MSVTRKLMAPGQFTLNLNKSQVPNSIVNQIDAWGHIVIVSGDVNVNEYSDDNLLDSASYVGIVYSLEIGDEENVNIYGQGLEAYLGDSDTRGMPIAETGGPSGVRSYKNKTLQQTLDFTGTPKGILRQEDGSQGPIRVGTVTEPTNGSTYTGKHYTESVMKAIKFVSADLGTEFKVNNRGILDAGPVESLFSGHDSDPVTIIVRDKSGEDPNISGIATSSLVAQYDASEFVSSVEMIANKYGAVANSGQANASSVPYNDLFGDPLKRVQYISEPSAESNQKDTRATAYLNELNEIKKTLNVSLEEYDIEGDFTVGDKIFIFDPDIGFQDTEEDRISDGRSSLYETVYQGQILNPTKIRILGVTWPVKQGYGVFYRKSNGTYLELTDYMMWESGDVQLEIGDVAPALGEALGFMGYTLDSTGAPDKSIPSQPTNSQGNIGVDTLVGTYSDGNGVSKAFIKLSWNQPLNTDGSTMTDGDYYRIRWRVVQDSDGNNIIDENDDQVTEYVYSNVEFDTREFIIYDLSPNTYYSVGVSAVDLSGFDSDYSSVTAVQTPADAGAPNKPDGFATIASNPLRVQFIHNLGQAKDNQGNPVSPVVDFTLSKDISHLNIYASTTQGFNLNYNSATKKVTNSGFKIGELKSTSAHILNGIAAVGYIDLDNADTHYFRVTAVDSSGNESEPSDEQSGNADLVNTANIANLAVTNALIANASITDLKVADVSAGKITAGTVSGQTIILDASGDTGNDSIIKSSNYSAGSTGWAITSDGTAEFRNATIRGSLNATDITAGTLNVDRLPTITTSEINFDAGDIGGADDTNIIATINASQESNSLIINAARLDLTGVLAVGVNLDNTNIGTIAGITISGTEIQSSNYSDLNDTGFKITSGGDAFFNSVDVRIDSSSSETPTTGTTTLDVGNSQIYTYNNNLYLNTTGTNNKVYVRDQLVLTPTSTSASNMQLMFDGPGSGDAMGFWHDTDFPNSSNAELYWTNQSGSGDYNKIAYVTTQDDYFHLGSDSPGIRTDFTGSPTFYFDGPGSPGTDVASFNMAIRPYAIKDKDGQLGTSGQILSSTGSRIDWIDAPAGSSGYYTNGIKINNLQMQDSYNFDVEAASGAKVSVTTRTSGGYAAVINHSDSDHSFSSGITSINSQTGSAITITSGFSNSGSPYVGVAGFSSSSNTITLGRSTQARCNILDPYSTNPKVGNSTSDRFTNIYSQSFYGTFYGQLINASSRNIKENIEDTTLGLDFLNDLTVKDFTMIDTDTFGTKKYTGFIAEEIEDYLTVNNLNYKLTESYRDNYEYKDKCSHIVYCENENFNCEDDCCSAYFRRDRGEGIVEMYLHETVEDCEAYMPDQHRHPHLYFNNFIGPLVKAVQELSTQISDLTARVEALEG